MFPAWFQIEGVVTTRNNDTLIGYTRLASRRRRPSWRQLVDRRLRQRRLRGNGGNDVIVGDLIRLDRLIGTYNNPDNAVGGAYAHTLADGTTNRVAASATLSAGLLGASGLSAAFPKHFTDMLQTERFKDLVLGDDIAAGAADIAKFSGNLAQYTLVALDLNGAVVANPHANWAQVYAIKVTDNRTAADLLDANGAPLLDSNGNLRVLEGIDLVIGVENFQFADQSITPAAYFDQAPVVDLRYVAGPVTVASDSFTGTATAYGRGTGWATNWAELSDNNNAGTGQILVANNALNITGGTPANSFNGATISRTVNLSAHTSALVSFNVTEVGLAAGQTVQAWFDADGAGGAAAQLLATYTAATNTAAPQSFTLSGPFDTDATLSFAASAMSSTANDLYIDNITITTPGDQFAGNTFSTTYTEQSTPATIASTPRITDADDSTLVSARIVLRGGVTGDRLNVGTMPPGVTATGNGTGTIILIGAASHAAYQAALTAITFSNPTNDNPTTANRFIDVTVNDGLRDSAVATTTVAVTPSTIRPSLALISS